MQTTPNNTTAKNRRVLLIAITLTLLTTLLTLKPAWANKPSEFGEWSETVTQIEQAINQIPQQVQQGDSTAVKETIRQAYYESYQVSGLEDQIKHRISRERNDEFTQQLLALRSAAREGATSETISAQVKQTINTLHKNVTEMLQTPELKDQWTQVAQTISNILEKALKDYQTGNADAAYQGATDAYLAHYEADGLEKATIANANKGFGRVTEVEGLFRELRQGYKNKATTQQMRQATSSLTEKITTDAADMDKSAKSETPQGWGGFLAAFIILIREGGEALLVVAAVITYALKAGRRDQVRGILIGVALAIALSIGLAVILSGLTASAATGMGQELIEGIAGLAAVLMLIYVSNWILNKSHGQKWQEYIEQTAGKGAETGGAFALATVSFLAVVREGAETILFFVPILSGAKNSSDHILIAAGCTLAAAILAALFILVWRFGVKLPMRPFFQWTSILLGILAVTIAGGAINEFQEATVVPTHSVPAIPTIEILGLYPTVETLTAQILVTGVLIILGALQVKQSRADKTEITENSSTKKETSVPNT